MSNAKSDFEDILRTFKPKQRSCTNIVTEQVNQFNVGSFPDTLMYIFNEETSIDIDNVAEKLINNKYSGFFILSLIL